MTYLIRRRALFCIGRKFAGIFIPAPLFIRGILQLRRFVCLFTILRKHTRNGVLCSLCGVSLFDSDVGTNKAVCSLISHRLFYLSFLGVLFAVLPECRSCPGISPQRFVPFGTLVFTQSWRYFAEEHIPFGRSFNFQRTGVFTDIF